jgi:adenylate cyclase
MSMAGETGGKSGGRSDGAWWGLHSLERSARLWSGIVLMVFVTSHLLNHALGVFGLDVMSAVQTWRSDIWRSGLGSALLYGAAGVHAGLALKRAVGRRTWRMPVVEALQIALGVAIPFMLIGHVVGTRAASSFAGADDSYVHVLRHLWPDNAAFQTAALLVVWTHGVIGLHYAFHTRRWFRKIRATFATAAVLIPALALAGFAASGREALNAATPRLVPTAAENVFKAAWLADGRMALAALAALCIGFLVFRVARAKLGGRIEIRYLGHGSVRAAVGQTVLEVSRAAGIPHPSACGGRGRCASCRVLVLSGREALPAPTGLEARMLERIRAPEAVRLACQIRPAGPLGVRVLGGADMNRDVAGAEALDWGLEDQLVILFADIRGFSTLAQNQSPTDLVVLLNRVMAEMSQAVQARGGRILQVQTDGVMAAFGLDGRLKAGSRAALHAATDMLKAVHLVNKDIRAALPLPLRIGIGIHCGEAVLSRAEDGHGGHRLIALGETVVIASRLEEATKELAADCVASAALITAAGLAQPTSPARLVSYKNGVGPVAVHAFGDRQELRAFLGRTATEAVPDPAQVAAA